MDKREQAYEKYATMFPKTVKYVKDNLMEYIRCVRCNSPVLRQPETGEDNPNEYPYQCMWCDENLYHLEVHAGSPATDEEVEQLIKDVIYSYDLDMGVEEDDGQDRYVCEECGRAITDDEGITTLTGRWVCDNSNCRWLDEDNDAHDLGEEK